MNQISAAKRPERIEVPQPRKELAAEDAAPHIVPVHYVGCERGVDFYAMQ